MEVDVAIIGAGFGGLAMAIAVQQRRLGSWVILEQADDIGGTWHENRYPGAACDVRSELYHYSFAPWSWSTEYPGQAEIHQYQQAVVDRYGLRPHLRLGDGVTSCTFDERRQRWHISTASGATYDARTVVAATGQLHRPRIPAVPGAERFTGPQFHTARFRHEVDLTGRRVAVIGAGASAIQVVPAIAAQVGHLTVFQRSAPYVMPKLNPSTSPWRRFRQRYAPWSLAFTRWRAYLMGELVGSGLLGKDAIRAKARHQWETYVDAVVRDPVLRQRVEPDYEIGCKRILLASDWYPTLQRDNVDLVTEAVTGIDTTGVHTSDGQHHAADVLIWATGFSSTDFLAPIVVTGRDGDTLTEAWASRPLAYRGVAVPGFPNFFLLYGPNTNLGSNSILFMLEAQVQYVSGLLQAARDARLSVLEVDRAAFAAWRLFIDEHSSSTAWLAGCTSWYQVDGVNTNNWPLSSWRYHQMLREIDLPTYLPVPVG